MSDNPRARNWVFTINNPTREDRDACLALSETVVAMICEEEHTREGEGTMHYQGYVSFGKQVYRSFVSRLLPRAYLAVARGTVKDNWKYCSKEGHVFIEKGFSLRNQYAGNEDYQEMYEDMKKLTPVEFENKYPKFWTIYHKNVMKIMIDHAMEHVTTWDGDLHSKNIWLWGRPGIGKSKWAAGLGPYQIIMKKNFNKWWDGYILITTKIVIIDDYPPAPQGNVLAQHIKVWGDRYPFIGECKGAHVMVEPGRFFFVVTANYPIEVCFEQSEDISAIKRRFHEIEMTDENSEMIRSMVLDRNILKE